MLTLASAARSFSHRFARPKAAATDNSVHFSRGQSPDAPDQASYFDTLMRLRTRRLVSRRAARRN